MNSAPLNSLMSLPQPSAAKQKLPVKAENSKPINGFSSHMKESRGRPAPERSAARPSRPAENSQRIPDKRAETNIAKDRPVERRRPEPTGTKPSPSRTIDPNQAKKTAPADQTNTPLVKKPSKPDPMAEMDPAQMAELAEMLGQGHRAVSTYPILAVLTGQVDQVSPQDIPGVVTRSALVREAMGADSLQDFMMTPRKLKEVVRFLDVDRPTYLKIKSRFNLESQISPHNLLSALRIDAQSVGAELQMLKDNLQLEGLSGYVQRSVNMRSQGPRGMNPAEFNGRGSLDRPIKYSGNVPKLPAENIDVGDVRQPSETEQNGMVARVGPLDRRPNPSPTGSTAGTQTNQANAQSGPADISAIPSVSDYSRGTDEAILGYQIPTHREPTLKPGLHDSNGKVEPTIFRNDIQSNTLKPGVRAELVQQDPYQALAPQMGSETTTLNYNKVDANPNIKLQQNFVQNGVLSQQSVEAAEIIEPKSYEVPRLAESLLADKVRVGAPAVQVQTPTIETLKVDVSQALDLSVDPDSLGQEMSKEGFSREGFSGDQSETLDFGKSGFSSNRIESRPGSGIDFKNIVRGELAKGPVLDKIVENASMMLKEGGGSMKIDLGSEVMGKLELALSVNKDNVGLRILTADERLRDVLVSEMPRLRDALGAQNLELKNVEVGLRTQSEAFANEQQERWQGGFGQPGQEQALNEEAKNLGKRMDSLENLSENYAQPIKRVMPASLNSRTIQVMA